MLGKTKVFIKYYTVQYLSRLYEEQVRKIVKVQALLRGVMAKLRKKRGASGARRRSRELSKDDAAIAIQKSSYIMSSSSSLFSEYNRSMTM